MLLKGIPPAFPEYLCQGRFKTVRLHGLLKDVECKVLNGRFPYRTIKIGSDWKIFCRHHSFRQGHKIIFECDRLSDKFKHVSSVIWRGLITIFFHEKRIRVKYCKVHIYKNQIIQS